MEKIELPHDQMILNTGEHHTGILFVPFGTEVPSEYTAEKAFTPSAGMRRTPIGGSGSGWTERPDSGKSELTKDAPIGEPWILLLFAATYGLWKAFYSRKRLFLFLIVCLCCMHLHAAITALSQSPIAVAAGETLTINPTIGSVPDGTITVCWGLYYDYSCTNAVSRTAFFRAPATGTNAVRFTTPSTAGTYYVKSALHVDAATCGGGTVDSYIVLPVVVYPADADLMLTRDAQGAGTRVDITDAVNKKAYGAMRFSKATLNNGSLSEYARYNYFVSFPFDVLVEDIYGIGEVGTHWRLFFYDGKGRAEEGFFADRTDNWVMIDDTDSVLHAGQGYLLQLNSIQMAEDNEEVWVNGKDVATLFFPALSTVNEVVATNETIPALSEAYRCTIDLSASLGGDADRREKDSWWRCVGVPSLASPSGMTGPMYLYVWNPANNNLTVTPSASVSFAPMHAYLMQHQSNIIWTGVTKVVNATVARQRDTNSYREWRMALLQDDEECDRTYVRMTEEATDTFDVGMDLSKELNACKANIYTTFGNERLAANVMPESENAIVPVGVKIEESGTYRLTIDGDAWITDNTTGSRAKDYTVYLNAGTHEGRFAIEVGETVPTGVQHIEDKAPRSVRKVLIDGILYIEKGNKKYLIL